MGPAPTEFYTLSLHDALPICGDRQPTPAACRHLSRMGRPVRDRCRQDRKSTRLNSSHVKSSYAVFCLKKKKENPVAAIPELTGGIELSLDIKCTGPVDNPQQR